VNPVTRNEAPLSPIERAVVTALVSAIVKELRAESPQPARPTSRVGVRWHTDDYRDLRT
jgi:hypothetical protein